MAINKQQVFQIADTMFADGEQPTLIKIRAALGSGSFSTISGYLAEWKTSTRAGDAVPAGDVPDEVEELFSSALGSMWAKAVALAQDTTKEALEGARLEREKDRAEVALAMGLADQLQAEADQLTQHAFKLSAQLDELREQNTEQLRKLAECAATEKEFRRMHSEVVGAFKAGGKVVAKKSAAKLESLKMVS